MSNSRRNRDPEAALPPNPSLKLLGKQVSWYKFMLPDQIWYLYSLLFHRLYRDFNLAAAAAAAAPPPVVVPEKVDVIISSTTSDKDMSLAKTIKGTVARMW